MAPRRDENRCQDADTPAGSIPPVNEQVPTTRVATQRAFDVVCVGNALMDHLAFAPFDVLDELGLPAGGMTLVDIETSLRIADRVGTHRRVPGGMVTNTAVGIASFGGRPAFIGAVAHDEPGERFAADLDAAGVRAVLERFPVDERDSEAATGRCFVVVTPDGERTMATALGVGGRLDRSGIDVDVLSEAALIYLEGYVLDLPDAPAIVERIVAARRRSGNAIAIGLADSLLVERHHAMLAALVREEVDLVFANETEICALAGESTVRDALRRVERPGLVTVATCGPDGALVGTDRGVLHVPVAPIDPVVDRTGAGDLFAAGFCFGYTHGADLEAAGALGALAAAEVIGHLGARPERPLADIASAATPL